LLDNLENDVVQSEHFKFLWWPHTDNVATINVDRTDKVFKSFHLSRGNLEFILNGLHIFSTACENIKELVLGLSYWVSSLAVYVLVEVSQGRIFIFFKGGVETFWWGASGTSERASTGVRR
jgi:hypothetical protein